MNNKGKSSSVKTLLVAILVVVLVLGVFMVAKNVQFGGDDTEPSACQESTAPVSWSSQNALNLNQAVPAISYLVQEDGGATAPNDTTYAVGAKLKYLASASGYIATINDVVVPCGGKTFTTKLTEVTSPTVDIFNSNNLIMDGVTTNQSAIPDGGSATLAIRMTGVNKKSTGDMLCLVEANSSVDSVTLGGATAGTQKPEIYSTQVATNSKVFTFEVPAIAGAISKNYDVVLTMKDNQHYTGEVFITCYAKQAFENTDGQFVALGVEDANGVSKVAQTTTASFIIN